MGDRANIVMQMDGQRVFFYMHDDGYNMPSVAQMGLKNGISRWSDPGYLARIVFSTLIAGREKDTTGFGISPFITDNSYPLLVIDVDQQKVVFESAAGMYNSVAEAVGSEFSFADFCGLNFAGRQEWKVVAGLPDDDE